MICRSFSLFSRKYRHSDDTLPSLFDRPGRKGFSFLSFLPETRLMSPVRHAKTPSIPAPFFFLFHTLPKKVTNLSLLPFRVGIQKLRDPAQRERPLRRLPHAPAGENRCNTAPFFSFSPLSEIGCRPSPPFFFPMRKGYHFTR